MNKYIRVDRTSFDFGMDDPLYPREIHTLIFIRERDGSFVTEIAAETGVTKGAVSQIVKKLEAKGLLERKPDPRNLSRMILNVTEKGNEACVGHECMHREKDVRFLDYLNSLDAEKVEFMHELFLEMDCWMDSYLD